MRIPALFLAVILALAPCFARAEDAPAASTTPKAFSDSERAAIESIIHDYLTKEHPETLMEAAQELQKRDMAVAETKADEAITKDKDKIFNNSATPVGGDPKGDLTVVEFFDYQCGYCKMSEAAVEKLLKEDKKVRFVYKDFPILGPASVTAAQASLASVRQGEDKYVKFHDILMNKKDHISEDLIMQSAKEAGLNADKLKKDMTDPAIQKVIEDNLALGQEIGVRGTPMFIIGTEVYPGALSYEQLKKAVGDARMGTKKS